jgi:crotonobetainyl-CoA:carnitine CoA-transferase CaiB-like acyl-CoA transferase
MVQAYEHPTIGSVRYPPSPVKFSEWDNPRSPAPMLGEHTRAVLSERLGLHEDELGRLEDEGVVGLWPERGTGDLTRFGH